MRQYEDGAVFDGALQNPFTPAAGKMPPVLAGRESLICDFEEALDNGAGAPGRLMLISGQLGFGKTAMLAGLGRRAEEHGWTVLSDTASHGLCDRLLSVLEESEIAAVNPSAASLGLRKAIESRFGNMSDGMGVLFAIDEARAASEEDLVAVATAIQHVLRDEDMRDVPDDRKHGVALVLAALPSMIDEVLNNKVLTLLRRSQQHVLAEIHLADVRAAYVDTVRESGKKISQDDASLVAQAADGYPSMVQLVGYYMWQSAERRGSALIERTDVERSVEDAVVAFGEAVCAPVMDGPAPAPRDFVKNSSW